jgi:hypothetical protein
MVGSSGVDSMVSNTMKGVSVSACCDGSATKQPVVQPGPDVFHVSPDDADFAVRSVFIAGASDFVLGKWLMTHGWLAIVIAAW